MIYSRRHWRLFCQLANTWTFSGAELDRFNAIRLVSSTALT